MTTNVNRISNAPQYHLMPPITDTTSRHIDIEMPSSCFIDHVELVVPTAFSTGTPTLKVGYVGATPDDEAFMASKTLGSVGAHTSANGKRMATTADDNLVRVTIDSTAAATDGVAWVKIWFGFWPNSDYIQDPDDDTGERYLLKPKYHIL